MKPHKGRIDQAVWVDVRDGHTYQGLFLDHPELKGKYGRTTLVVKDDADIPRHKGDSYEIETLNSRYTIMSPSSPGVQTR